MGKVSKKVKDEEGNEYEIEFDDDEDDDEEDEDDDNIYLTEKDLRWLKEQRKSAGSQSSNDQTKPQSKTSQKKSGIPVKKGASNKSSTTQNQTRVKKLSLR